MIGEVMNVLFIADDYLISLDPTMLSTSPSEVSNCDTQTSGSNLIESWSVNKLCFHERLREKIINFGSIFPLKNIILAAAKDRYFDCRFSNFKRNIKHLVECFVFLKTEVLMEKCYPAEWRDNVSTENIEMLQCRMAVLPFPPYLETYFCFLFTQE